MKLPWASRRRERELDEELRSHLAMAVRDRLARGERPADAEDAARRELGNLGLVKEVTREMWGGGWFDRLMQDVRYGARTLRRSPAFTIVAVLTLALGIGATTAVFTVVHGVLLRPLPYPGADRLYQLSLQPWRSTFFMPPGLSDRHWVEFHQRARHFASAAAISGQQVNLTVAGDPVRLAAVAVTPEFFSTLGVAPMLGRGFVADENVLGRDRVVVLGHTLWRSRFAADSSVIGSMVTIDGSRHTVVGVMPPGFSYPEDAQLWRPLVVRIDPNLSVLMSVIGRLRDGATREQALAELESIGRALPPAPGEDREELAAQLVPLKESVVGGATRSLLVFAGAVALVLLIACANVANLLLMRATGREREIAVRAALGAGRRRLVRQLVTESVLLSFAGGLAGMLVAAAGVRLLLAMAPATRIPRRDEIGFDTTALVFTLGVSLLTGILFGLAPAFRATRRDLRDTLAASARTTTGRDGGIRGALVIGEIALALVLLAGAGLMVQSFARMRSVELGFTPSQVAVMTVDLPTESYRSAAAMRAFHQSMLERLAQLPGVVAAGAVNWRPLGGALISGEFETDGAHQPAPSYTVDKPIVSPGYFRAMGIRLLRGRDFAPADDDSAPRVAIVSASVARQVWPGLDAIGQRISMEARPGPGDWITVVGVVDDVVQQDLTSPADPAIYLPYMQTTMSFFLGHMTFAVRVGGAPEAILPAMRRTLREVDRHQPVGSIGTMDAFITETAAEPLFQARLLAAFSAIALLLAAVGIYGVVAYSVAERTHEIGIRVALGARRGDVVRMVLRRTLRLVVPGVAIGIIGALAVTRVLSSFLFAVKPNDPATFAAVALLLAGVAVLAGLVPAHRASRVDPLVALRAGG